MNRRRQGLKALTGKSPTTASRREAALAHETMTPQTSTTTATTATTDSFSPNLVQGMDFINVTLVMDIVAKSTVMVSAVAIGAFSHRRSTRGLTGAVVMGAHGGETVGTVNARRAIRAMDQTKKPKG